MASRDGRKMWAGELPVEVVEAVKQEAKGSDKAMWEIMNEATKMYLGLEDASTEAAVKRHIDRLEGEVDSLESELEAIQEELSKKHDRLADYRDKLVDIQDQKQSYEQRLENILEDLEANPSKKIIGHRKEIRSLATDHHGKPSTENREAVKEDLWQLAMDGQRDVSRHQFSESMNNGSPTRAATDGSGSTENVPRAVREANQANTDGDDPGDTDDSSEADVDRGDGVMTDGGVDRPRDEIQHLVCSACNDGPRVARFGEVAKLVCHCTHVDGYLEPVPINEMAVLPDPWSYGTNGQTATEEVPANE